MTEELSINGKAYLSASRLSKEFSYTPDYIARLAREEKILATRLGRVWFVEPVSLEIYTKQIDLEKEIRKEELQQRRIAERKWAEQKERSFVNTSDGKHAAVIQSAVLVAMGVVIGVFGFVNFNLNVIGSGSFTSQLSLPQHISDMSAQLVRTTLSVFIDRDEFNYRNENLDYVYSPKISSVDSPDVRFTVLPEFPERPSTSSSVASSTITEEVNGTTNSFTQLVGEFSDEVNISVNDDDEILIQPIFKHSTGTKRRILLEEINERNF